MARLVKTQVEMEGRFEDRWVLVEPEDHIEAWPDSSELVVVGRPAPRLTGPRRVSGAARFVSDISLPGMLEAHVLRSPHAHARVELDLVESSPEGRRLETRRLFRVVGLAQAMALYG